jgi:hypothetical protein
MTNLASYTFRIPYEFRERFAVIQIYLRQQTRQRRITISQLVDAMLDYAREVYDSGRLELNDSSLSRQTKILLSDGENAVLLSNQLPERQPRPADAPLKNANYRISTDNHDLLLHLCRKDFLSIFGYAKGEALVLLLEHVMQALQAGRARLVPGDPVAIEDSIPETETEN